MSQQPVLQILERVGAVLTGTHVVYTSGRHGETYVNKDALYTSTEDTSAVCKLIAEHFAAAAIDVVAGPTVGGVILAQWVAHHSAPRADGRRPAAIYAEEIDGLRVFRRGYADFIPGRRVLVVEDILTTGGSARKVVEAVRAAGGEVAGLGVLCNRGGITAEMVGVPELYALTALPLSSWDATDCPLCRAGVPINTKVGKGGKS
jgi:orotate phosphoribosyltransferase